MKSNTSSDSLENQSSFSEMRTSGLIVEHRHPSVALSVDLARHIAQCCVNGKIAVVTSNPQALLSSVRKQWLRLIRLAQREKSSTLNRQRVESLGEIIRTMMTIGFSAKDPATDPLAYVSFAKVEQFLVVAPTCATLYITEPVTKLDQHILTSWMRPGGVVVIYDE